MAAYQMFDFTARSIRTSTYDTKWSTPDGRAVKVQVDVYANSNGSYTSLIRTLIDGSLYFNRKPVTYGSLDEAEINLPARIGRTLGSMSKKALANGGSFPRSRR